MTLIRKTLLVLAAASAVSILLSYMVLRGTVYKTFIELENSWAVNNTETVEAAIQSHIDSLMLLHAEYSQWDDTYIYMQERDEEFINKNINAEILQRMDLDFVTIFDTQGQLVFGIEQNSDYGVVFQSKHPFTDHDAVHDLISASQGTATELVGMIDDRLGPLLVISMPVLPSDAQGPPAGSIVFGQALTEERIQRLSDQLSIEFDFIPITSKRLTSDLRHALESLDNTSSELPQARESERVLNYRAVRNILGERAFVLEVAAEREISVVGARAVNIALAFLAATSLLYLLVSTLSLKRLIISPVSELTRHVGRLQRSGDLSRRIASDRNDEIGTLTNRVDSLVMELDTAHDQMAEARDTALQASKAKSEFLATMSHEIRTPINGVLGMTELLLESQGLSDKQRRYAATVQQSGNSLLHVVNDILDISKIEAGKVELDIAPFNLRHSVEDCLDLLAEGAHRKGLELIGAIALDTHTYVQGDSVRLNQVLTNLISNAVKFTEYGEIVVSVRELRDQTDTANYRFEVRDTGIGINQKNKERLFEPFSQEDGSTTRRYGGTGLGLSICEQLIELMGGEIGVDSVPGQGATFWFTAHLTKDEETSEFPQPQLLAEKTVLIIDDNETNREILRHQLEGWHMRAEENCSGVEALDRLVGNSHDGPIFDVVLLDMHMPEMDGLRLARAIRKEPGYRRVPLVMLSSLSVADNDDERGAARLDAWLTKPVRQARLHDTLVSLFSKGTLDTQNGNTEHESENAGHGGSEDGLRILLAEDNDVNQAVAVTMLESLGHQITVTTNGQEAVAAFESQEFDLVLMDCRMPELDGYDATRAIRQWEDQQNLRPTWIVALTANALEGDRENCLAAGMNDYLSKPFTKEQLNEVVGPGARVSRVKTDGSADNPPESTGRILIVEDDVTNQQVTQAMLASLGYHTVVADNGDEALRTMSRERFDLVLMDCHMPVRDGYDTTEEIRRREECSGHADRIPIVAVTADFLESNRKKCQECGMDDYVTKPITQEHMRIVLTRWLLGSVDDDSVRPVAIDDDGFSDLGETTTLASINTEMLEELRELDSSPDSDIVREIIISYCATSTKVMLQLRSAVAEGDCKNIELIAHSLMGSSGQIGATLLASLCEGLISSAKQNDLSNAKSLCERVAIEHAAVISGLDKELQRMAA